MNVMPSHAGALDPVISNATSSASYSVAAWQPTLYGTYTVNGRSLCLYEKFGAAEWMYGRHIACCDIRPYWILYPYPYYPYKRELQDAKMADVSAEDEYREGGWDVPEDLDPDTELLTLAEYEKIFGEAFDPEAFSKDVSSSCASP